MAVESREGMVLRGGRLCAECFAPSTTRCGRCHVTPYCSSVCQRKSWRTHKKYCKLNSYSPRGYLTGEIKSYSDDSKQYQFILIRASHHPPKSYKQLIDQWQGIEFDPDAKELNCKKFKWSTQAQKLVVGYSEDDLSYQCFFDDSFLKKQSVPNHTLCMLFQTADGKGAVVVGGLSRSLKDHISFETSQLMSDALYCSNALNQPAGITKAELARIVMEREEAGNSGEYTDRLFRENMRRGEMQVMLKGFGIKMVPNFDR